MTESSSPDEGRRLILRAFEAAKQSGRDSWSEMTTAVLKNRLLNLTERAFKEEDYGAPNFTAFVRRYPDLLALDETSMPPKVILIGDVSSTAATEASVAGRRIRQDLWTAIIDYQSGESYYWNGSQVITGNEDDTETLRKLPTVSQEEMKKWREEFSQSITSRPETKEAEIAQVNSWYANFLPTKELPVPARAAWNEELKQRVISRLADWFRRESLTPPIDLVQRRPQSRRVVSSETAQLRELVLRCVRSMTDEELRGLKLPPTAVLRVLGHGTPTL